jgi:hypothetical protein
VDTLDRDGVVRLLGYPEFLRAITTRELTPATVAKGVTYFPIRQVEVLAHAAGRLPGKCPQPQAGQRVGTLGRRHGRKRFAFADEELPVATADYVIRKGRDGRVRVVDLTAPPGELSPGVLREAADTLRRIRRYLRGA